MTPCPGDAIAKRQPVMVRLVFDQVAGCCGVVKLSRQELFAPQLRHRLLHVFHRILIVEFRLFFAKTSNLLAKSQRGFVHFLRQCIHSLQDCCLWWCFPMVV